MANVAYIIRSSAAGMKETWTFVSDSYHQSIPDSRQFARQYLGSGIRVILQHLKAGMTTDWLKGFQATAYPGLIQWDLGLLEVKRR